MHSRFSASGLTQPYRRASEFHDRGEGGFEDGYSKKLYGDIAAFWYDKTSYVRAAIR